MHLDIVVRRAFVQCVITVILLFACTATSVAAAPDDLPTLDQVAAKLPRFDVSGRIVDAQDKPVPGCQVAVYFDSGDPGLRDRVLAQGTSDAAGEFRFPDSGLWEPPIPGGYRDLVMRLIVIAFHPQHGMQYAVLLKNDKTAGLALKLDPVQPRTITVTDFAGKPVEGANVWLGVIRRTPTPDPVAASRIHMEVKCPISFLSALSDAAGHVTLLCPAGNVWFYAHREGYARGAGTDKIKLYPAKTVSGMVRQEDGTPLAGAVVRMEYECGGTGYDDQQLTGPDGRYSISAPVFGFKPLSQGKSPVVQGRIRLQPKDTRPGSLLISSRRTLELNAETPLEQDLTLERGCILAGTVVDMTTGKPVPNFSFTRDMPIQGSNYLDVDRIQTDEHGQFKTSAPRRGEVRLSLQNASVPGYMVDSDWYRGGNVLAFRSNKLESDRTDLAIKVKLLPLTKSRGRVVDVMGKTVAKATVCGGRSLTTTDETGRFTLDKVIVNGITSNVTAWSPDKQLAAEVPMVDPSQELIVTLQPLQEREVIALTTDGLPANDLTIDYGGMFVREFTGTVKTDATGRATVKNLVAGARYEFNWQSDHTKNRDYDLAFTSIDLADLKSGEPIRLQVRRYTNAIMGTVVDESGKPIAGASVRIGFSETMRRREDQSVRLPIKTDSLGRFSISRLSAGVIHFQISADGYLPATAGTLTDNADFRPVLRRADAKPACVVRVVDEGGKALPSQLVRMWTTSYRPSGDVTALAGEATTDRDGQAKLAIPAREDDAPMRILLACEPAGRNLAIGTISPNEDSEIYLVASKSAGHWRGRVVDESDRPLAGAKVRVISIAQHEGLPTVGFSTLPGDADDPLGLTVTADAAGRFQLPRLGTIGTMQVQATANGLVSPQAWFSDRGLSSDKNEKTIIVGQKGCTLIGRIVDQATGKPMQLRNGAGLSLQPVGQGAAASLTSRLDGRFAITDMPPGDYELSGSLYFDNPQYVCRSPIRVRLEPGHTAEVTMPVEPGIRVSGRLIDAKTGKPVRGGSIEARMANSSQFAHAEFDDEGRWVAYLPDEGDYLLVYYSMSGRADAKPKTIHVQRGKPLEEVVIEIQ